MVPCPVSSSPSCDHTGSAWKLFQPWFNIHFTITLAQGFFKHVEMAGILPTAVPMFVINILNVRVIIAYPGSMCAMEYKTVHLERMNTVVFSKIAQDYSNVLVQICVSIIMSSVTT